MTNPNESSNFTRRNTLKTLGVAATITTLYPGSASADGKSTAKSSSGGLRQSDVVKMNPSEVSDNLHQTEPHVRPEPPKRLQKAAQRRRKNGLPQPPAEEVVDAESVGDS